LNFFGKYNSTLSSGGVSMTMPYRVRVITNKVTGTKSIREMINLSIGGIITAP
jgi:hypothetical protein